jgi:hypothetical protein
VVISGVPGDFHNRHSGGAFEPESIIFIGWPVKTLDSGSKAPPE